MRTTSTISESCHDAASVSAQAGSKARRSRAGKQRIPADDFRSIMLVNARFYSAFSSLDMVAMQNVWLDDERCICHFPNMKRLVGKPKIMKSFQFAVNEMDGAVRRNWMEPAEVQIEFQSSEKATIFCQENMYSITCRIVEGELRPESQLISKLSATNAFRKVDGKWHLWYHQASAIGDSDTKFKLPPKPKDSEQKPKDLPKAVLSQKDSNVKTTKPRKILGFIKSPINRGKLQPSATSFSSVTTKTKKGRKLQPTATSYSEMTMSFDTKDIHQDHLFDCGKHFA